MYFANGMKQPTTSAQMKGGVKTRERRTCALDRACLWICWSRVPWHRRCIFRSRACHGIDVASRAFWRFGVQPSGRNSLYKYPIGLGLCLQ